MKIKKVTDEVILFDNGNTITFDHEQDCCENNYADFEQIEPQAMNTEFEEPLTFEAIENAGFRFGNLPGKMFFIPCYSSQNGYYSTDIRIEYNGETVLAFDCEEAFH
jgi:hypothetical protein